MCDNHFEGSLPGEEEDELVPPQRPDTYGLPKETITQSIAELNISNEEILLEVADVLLQTCNEHAKTIATATKVLQELKESINETLKESTNPKVVKEEVINQVDTYKDVQNISTTQIELINGNNDTLFTDDTLTQQDYTEMMTRRIAFHKEQGTYVESSAEDQHELQQSSNESQWLKEKYYDNNQNILTAKIDDKENQNTAKIITMGSIIADKGLHIFKDGVEVISVDGSVNVNKGINIPVELNPVGTVAGQNGKILFSCDDYYKKNCDNNSYDANEFQKVDIVDIVNKVESKTEDKTNTKDKMEIKENNTSDKDDKIPLINPLHKLDYKEQEQLERAIFKKALYNVEKILNINRDAPSFKESVLIESDRLLNAWVEANSKKY